MNLSLCFYIRFVFSFLNGVIIFRITGTGYIQKIDFFPFAIGASKLLVFLISALYEIRMFDVLKSFWALFVLNFF